MVASSPRIVALRILSKLNLVVQPGMSDGFVAALTQYGRISLRSFNPATCRHKIQPVHRPLLQKLCWNCSRESSRVADRALCGFGMVLFTGLHTTESAWVAVELTVTADKARSVTLCNER